VGERPSRERGAEHSQRVTRAYLRYAFIDALCFRGYWLVLSVYLVLVADLSPFQLVFLGTATELSVMVSEIPTGVMADTISRKWSVALSCVLSGGAALMCSAALLAVAGITVARSRAGRRIVPEIAAVT
jgi:MFS family permease